MEKNTHTNHKAKHPPKGPKQEIKTAPEHITEVDETAISELAAKLSSDGRFDFKLTKEYKVDVISEAVSRNWSEWDEIKRKLISGFFIYAYKHRDDLDKGIDVMTLRVQMASKILDLDPINASRILASVVTNGPKPSKSSEINMRLCKAIQSHIIQDKSLRYEKLFITDLKEETQIVLQHIVAAIAGQYSDLKDPNLALKQLQLVTSLLNSNTFKILDKQSVLSIVGAMRSWPMSMTGEVTAIYDLFSSKFPGEHNPFESVIPTTPVAKTVQQLLAAQTSEEPVQGNLIDSVASLASTQQNIPTLPMPAPPKPEPAPRNLSDPREVILIVTGCLNKLEDDIAAKQQDVEKLNQTIEQLRDEKQRNDEVKDKKRQVFEAAKEDNRKLKEEINQLKSTINTKSEIIETLQNEKSKLVLDLATSEEKVSGLVSKHEQSVEHLSNSIDNVSNYMVSELKKSLEMDLKREFDELAHLPTDENCIFHMDVINAIFRKLRDKGIDVGGNQ